MSLASNPQSVPFKLKVDPNVSPGNTARRYGQLAEHPTPEPDLHHRGGARAGHIQGLAFHPQNITVAKGTLVTWINLDSNIGCCDPGNHNVVFLSGANGSSPTLKRLDSWNYTFNAQAWWSTIARSTHT